MKLNNRNDFAYRQVDPTERIPKNHLQPENVGQRPEAGKTFWTYKTYLYEKYSGLREGYVSVSPEYLRKAAIDPMFAAKLEQNLSSIPSVMAKMRREYKAQGKTMSTFSVTISGAGDRLISSSPGVPMNTMKPDPDDVLESVRANREKREKRLEELQVRARRSQERPEVGSSAALLHPTKYTDPESDKTEKRVVKEKKSNRVFSRADKYAQQASQSYKTMMTLGKPTSTMEFLL